MRFFFTGPRFFGIRPGIIFNPNDFRRIMRGKSSQNAMTGSFVYVIEGESGHHKIGVSRDPIQRMAQLQTGSHVPLKFAYIGVTPGTGYDIEGCAHELLDAHRKEGEWFLVPASIAIGAALEAASRLGEPIQQVPPEKVPLIIYLANQHGSGSEAAPPMGPLKAAVIFIAILSALYLMLAIGGAGAQPLPAHTIDRAVSCPKEEDFGRYAALVADDVSAAILFYHDHGCVMMDAQTFVKIDKGKLQNPSGHVCIRPVGSYDCFWTFAGHVKASD